MAMFIRQVLADKGDRIVTARPEMRVAEVVKLLRSERIGAVVVTDLDGGLCGILSERDIARGLAEHEAGLLEMKVEELMTAHVVTCGPDDGVAELMRKMTSGRFRHLPVVEEGRLAGIISIGDVVKYRLQELESEASLLQDYIVGAA